MAEGFQAGCQGLANRQGTGVDDPSQRVGGQRDGQGDDCRGQEGLSGWGDPAAAQAPPPRTLTVSDDRREVRGGDGGVGEEAGCDVECGGRVVHVVDGGAHGVDRHACRGLHTRSFPWVAMFDRGDHAPRYLKVCLKSRRDARSF